MSSYETIAAVATGLGKSAIAVVRVSGPACDNIMAALSPGSKICERKVKLLKLQDSDGALLDRALVIRFAAPRSYTGEDMIEFQVTGGQAVVSGLLSTLKTLPNVRLAEPGEFARRAFENGKLDLDAVEGLVSIVDAETSAQLRQAHAMTSGAVRLQCNEVRGLILEALADVEAMLDFSDVEDADHISLKHSRRLMSDAEKRLQALLDRSKVTERLRSGMLVAIAGPPNSGKSSLLNYLARRDIAIVSPFPGTTRDILEVALDLGGYPVNFADTAGIRETVDPIEAEGIKRGVYKTANADLVLWLQDGEDSDEDFPTHIDALRINVATKIDLQTNRSRGGHLAISSLTGEGVDELVREVELRAREFFAGVGDIALNTDRQFSAVRDALTAIGEAKLEISGIECVAESLRRANRALGRVSGEIGVEEVLGEIFARLCVGK